MQINVSINRSGSVFPSNISKQCASLTISGNSRGNLEITQLPVRLYHLLHALSDIRNMNAIKNTLLRVMHIRILDIQYLSSFCRYHVHKQMQFLRS